MFEARPTSKPGARGPRARRRPGWRPWRSRPSGAGAGRSGPSGGSSGGRSRGSAGAGAGTGAGLGRAVADGLAAYLQATVGRPRGALTPAEARAGVARATGRDDLARRAGDLVARSDRARFDDVRAATDPALRADARGLFEDLLRGLDAADRLNSEERTGGGETR